MTKGICQGTIDFLVRPPKLVDGIFEVWWHLRKFWWVKQIVRIENDFALTDFFAKQTKFRELALTETSSARLVCMTCFSKFCYLSVFFLHI